MIRFLRIVVLVLILAAVLVYVGLRFFSVSLTDRMEEPLTSAVVAHFSPGEDCGFSYDAHLSLFPLQIEVTGLLITAPSIRLDGTTWNDISLSADMIVCELVPLLRDQEVVIARVTGRSFEGRLGMGELEALIRRNSQDVRGLTIEKFHDRCRVTGNFYRISTEEIAVIGDWAVDEDSEINLVNREYFNPHSRVPEGATDMVDNCIDMRVGIRLFERELKAVSVEFRSDGLTVTASDN